MVKNFRNKKIQKDNKKNNNNSLVSKLHKSKKEKRNDRYSSFKRVNKNNNKQSKIKDIMDKKKIKKVKQRRRNSKVKKFAKVLNTVSPFHLSKENSFFYDIEKFNDYLKYTNDINKYKLNCEERGYIQNIINEINSSKLSTSNLPSLEVIPEIYQNFIKMVKVKRPLSKRALIIKEIIEEHKNSCNLSLRKLKELYLIKTNEKKISLSTISYILKYSLNLRFLKTCVKPKKLTDIVYKRKSYFLIRIIYQILIKHLELIFVDESKIQVKNSNFKYWRSTKDSFTYGNMKQEKVNLILAVSQKKVVHYLFSKKNTNEVIFEEFIKKVYQKLSDEEKEKAVIFFDNAKFHKTELLKNFYRKNRCKIVSNVPYESSFDSVELSFRHIKNILYKKLYDKIDDMIDDTEKILKSNEFINSLRYQFKETLEKYLYYSDKYYNDNLNIENA